MNAPPQEPVQIPNYTNYQPDQELLRLRKRLSDLLRLGAGTPETFQQTLLQIWGENERRRQSCMQEADEHLRQYHALVAQAHAFSTQSSIVYSVINGYVVIEEKRIQEMLAREKEQAEKEQAQQEMIAREKKLIEDERQQASAATNGHPATSPKSRGGKRPKP